MVSKIIELLKEINEFSKDDYVLDIEAFTSLLEGGLKIKYRLVMTLNNVSFVSHVMTASEALSEIKKIRKDMEFDKYELSSSNRWSYVRSERETPLL